MSSSTMMRRGAAGIMPFAEPGVARHYAPDRSVRIESIDLALTLEPEARTFTGRAVVRITPLACYAGRFALDLAEVVVESVTDGAGKGLSWELGDGQLTVRASEAPAEVVVRWHGSNPTCGLYFTGPTELEPERQHMAWTQCQDEDGHFVFPCHDHPGVKHPWALTIDAPAGYTVLSNGARLSVSEEGGRVVGRFAVEQPMPAYLVSFVAAKLSETEADSVGDVSVRYFVPVGEEEAVERSFGRTPAMISWFSEITRTPYPWPRYDQVVVHDFIFGGMENVGCTTMARLLLVDEKAAIEWDPDGLVSHELAHQWFGDYVTCQDWSQGWLNESWATYLEAVWWEHDRTEAETIWYRHETARGYFGEASGRYQRPIVSYQFREPIDVFDRHLYNKGSCVLWTLRHELGDEAFWGATAAYLAERGHDTVHTRDFQRAFERHTGRNLDGFFHQWLHSAGHPKLAVKLGKGDGLVTVTVKQEQEGDDVPEAFALKLALELVANDGTVTPVTLPIAERERTWAIPVASDVRTVRVDPGYRVLAEITLAGPEAWLQALLHDPCPVLSVRAAAGLIDDGGATAVDAVREAAVSHAMGDVRGDLCRQLAKRGGQADRDVLMKVLATDASPKARRHAAAGLGSFRDEVAASALLAALDGPLPTWHLQGELLLSLGKTRDPRAAEAILPQLAVDSWADLVRQRAVAALAELEDDAHLERLLASTRAGSARLRSAAAMALARLGEAVHEARRPARERLVEMLNEPGFRTQNAAIGALGKLKDPASLGPLAQVHATAPDGRTRRMAYEAMVRIKEGGTPGDLSALRSRVDQLAEENRTLRDRIDRLERVTP